MKNPRKHYLQRPGKLPFCDVIWSSAVPVSDLCDQYHIQPSMFYNWQKQFFENGAAAFRANSLGAREAPRAKDRRPSR